MLHAAFRVAVFSSALLAFASGSHLCAQAPYVVTAHGILPGGGDDTAAFAVLLALVPPGATIQFPHGDYHFSSTGEADQIFVDHKMGLTIEGDTTQPTRLLFANRDGRALHIQDCTDVTVRDLVIEYETPPWTQGLLKGVDSGRMWIDILVSQGYETPTGPPNDTVGAVGDYLYENADAISVHDPVDRRLRPKFDQFYIRSGGNEPQVPFEPSPANPGWLRVHLVQQFDLVAVASSNPHRMQTNDLIIVKGGGCHSIRVERCKDTVMRRVTARRTGWSAFLDLDSTRSTYDECVVAPIGNDLVSTTGDGIHVNCSRGQVTITDNSFERTGDDGIACMTQAFTVIEQLEGTSVLAVTSSGDIPTISSGDVFEFFDQDDFKTVAVAAVDEVAGPTWNGSENRTEWVLKFAGETGAKVGNESVNLAFVEGGTVVTGNTIRNHRARGMLFKVSNVEVGNNVISGSTYCGISFGPEFYYDSATFTRNATIYGNKIFDVGTYSLGVQQSGAISVQVGVLGGSTNGPLVSEIARQNMDIVIHDNKIRQSGGPAVLLTNVEGANVYENDMLSSLWNESLQDPGYFGMGTIHGAVHLDNCGGLIQIHDNRIETTIAPPLCDALSTHGSAGWSLTNNQRVFHTGFESMHHDLAPPPAPQQPGIPSVGSAFVYNLATPSWSASEDARLLNFVKWGLFGIDPALPYYIDRQTSRCDEHTGKLEVEFTAPATRVDFTLGASALTNSWNVEGWLIPVPYNSTTEWKYLGHWQNTANDLSAGAPPHWKAITKTFPVPPTSGNWKLRFVRLNVGSPPHASLYLDDVVLWMGLIPNQSAP